MPTMDFENRRKGQVDPVDAHVGSKLRMRRALVGMSQGQLGATVGVSFQQVQKYERGTNRIGASRLYQFAHVLSVPVSYFFEELEYLKSTHKEPIENERIYNRETLSLVCAYYGVTDRKQRGKIMSLIKAMAVD